MQLAFSEIQKNVCQYISNYKIKLKQANVNWGMIKNAKIWSNVRRIFFVSFIWGMKQVRWKSMQVNLKHKSDISAISS